MRKQLLTKMLLIAASLFVGTSAWAYDVPDGYEIKTAIMGTNNGDGTVTAENFTSATVVPTGWVAGDNVALSIGDVTEVTDLVVDNHGPSYVSGKCLGVAASGRDWNYKFATYSFAAVSSGYLVFNGDFYVNDNQSAYLKFADEDGNNVFSFYPNSGNNGQTFRYALNDGAATASSYQTKPRTYKGWRIRDLVFDMGTGALTFKLTYIQFTSGGTSEQTTNVAYNIGTGKNIAKLMIGSNTNNANATKTTYLDNVSLFTVGVSAAATTYTVNAVSGGTTLQLLATGTASKDDEYSVYVPRVIEKDGDFYVWDEAETAPNYKKTYTMGSTSEVKEIGYTKNSNIVSYIEGESVAGTNESYSNGSAGPVAGQTHLTAGRAFGTHPAGKYKFTVYVTGNDGRGIAVRNNAVDDSSNEYTQVRSEGTGKKEKTFILPEERTLIVNGHWTSGTKTNQSGDFDYAILEYVEDLPANEKIVVTAASYATYVSNYNLDFTSATTKAYKVNVASKGVATLTEVAKVPAKTPVLLYVAGGNGEGENIAVTTDAVDAVSGNDLVAGTGAAVATVDGTYTNMILNNGSKGIGFYFAAGQTVAANRAYLHIATTLAPDAVGAGSRMSMVFDDEATGVDATLVNSEKVNSEVYDLQGRRVAQPTKGLYIVNGKKVIIK